MFAARLDPTFKRQSISVSPDMQWPLIVSMLFHALIVTGFTVGLPFVKKDTPMIITPPISVEIVDISELTQTNKIATPKKVEKKPEPKPEESKPKPVKMTSEAPPDLTQPKAPEIPDPVPMPEEIKKPDPIKPKPEPVTKKEPPPPKKKPKPKVTKKPAKEEAKDFASLLKNLTPDAAEAKQDSSEDAVDDNPANGQIARLSDSLTISEQDALRRQLAGCWNVLAGARNAEDLVVPVRVYMNPDRTVNRASILDTGRYNRDTHFRAAADSALRALRNPKCTPLQLPPDKYEQWKTIVINFDPRDIL